MYIHGVVWITHLDTALATSSVISVKRGKERRRRGSLVDANAWLRSVLHLLQSCQGPICDRRTVENQSNGKRLRRYRLPLLTRSSRFVCSFVRYLGHTPGALLGLGCAPGRCSRPSCGPDRTNQQFLFKTISGTELLVCTQTCRSANWTQSERYFKMYNTIILFTRISLQDQVTLGWQ